MAPFFNEIVIKSLRNAANTPVGDAQHSLTSCTWLGHSHNVPVARNPTFQFKPKFTSKSHIIINKHIYPSHFLSFSWWKCITSQSIITALVPPGNLQSWPWTTLQPCRAHGHCTGAICSAPQHTLVFLCLEMVIEIPNNQVLKVARFWFKTGSDFQNLGYFIFF